MTGISKNVFKAETLFLKNFIFCEGCRGVSRVAEYRIDAKFAYNTVEIVSLTKTMLLQAVIETYSSCSVFNSVITSGLLNTEG
jgi:hypothetical protein